MPKRIAKIVRPAAAVQTDTRWKLCNAMASVASGIRRLERLMVTESEVGKLDALTLAYNNLAEHPTIQAANSVIDEFEANHRDYRMRRFEENKPQAYKLIDDMSKLKTCDERTIAQAVSTQYGYTQAESYGLVHEYNEHKYIGTLDSLVGKTPDVLDLTETIETTINRLDKGFWIHPSDNEYTDDRVKEAAAQVLSEFFHNGRGQHPTYIALRSKLDNRVSSKTINSIVESISESWNDHLHALAASYYATESPNKIPTVKLLRTITGFGLTEAKDIVDAEWSKMAQ